MRNQGTVTKYIAAGLLAAAAMTACASGPSTSPTSIDEVIQARKDKRAADIAYNSSSKADMGAFYEVASASVANIGTNTMTITAEEIKALNDRINNYHPNKDNQAVSAARLKRLEREFATIDFGDTKADWDNAKKTVEYLTEVNGEKKAITVSGKGSWSATYKVGEEGSQTDQTVTFGYSGWNDQMQNAFAKYLVGDEVSDEYLSVPKAMTEDYEHKPMKSHLEELLDGASFKKVDGNKLVFSDESKGTLTITEASGDYTILTEVKADADGQKTYMFSTSSGHVAIEERVDGYKQSTRLKYTLTADDKKSLRSYVETTLKEIDNETVTGIEAYRTALKIK
jgi:hypothetical protein